MIWIKKKDRVLFSYVYLRHINLLWWRSDVPKGGFITRRAEATVTYKCDSFCQCGLAECSGKVYKDTNNKDIYKNVMWTDNVQKHTVSKHNRFEEKICNENKSQIILRYTDAMRMRATRTSPQQQNSRKILFKRVLDTVLKNSRIFPALIQTYKKGTAYWDGFCKCTM